MMTMGSASGPFIVGENPLPAANTSLGNKFLTVTPANPAARTGILASVIFTATGPDTATIYTGALNTSTGAFAITASTSVPFTTGTNTYPVTLAINAGDCIGFWYPASNRPIMVASGAGDNWYVSASIAPSTGVVSGLAHSLAEALCIQATGS